MPFLLSLELYTYYYLPIVLTLFEDEQIAQACF